MGLRMSPAWYFFVRDDGPPPCGGRPPWASAGFASSVGFAAWVATGNVTKKYQGTLRKHGFKNMMGDNASAQPGHMQEVLLHETAVSWIRLRLAATVPSKPWLETRGSTPAGSDGLWTTSIRIWMSKGYARAS